MRVRIALLFVALGLAAAVGGCGKHEVSPPGFTKADYGCMLDTDSLSRLQNLAAKGNRAGLRLAVLTVDSIAPGDALAFGNRAFESFPTFRGVVSAPGLPKLSFWERVFGPKEGRIRQAWEPNGVLIVFSKHPRLIQVRMGANIKRVIPDSKLYQLLSGEVYPVLDQGYGRKAIVRTAELLVSEVSHTPVEFRHPNWIQRNVNGAIGHLSALSLPEWKWYYSLVFDPVLNAVLVALGIFGAHVWVLVACLVCLALLLRPKVVAWVFLFPLRLFGVRLSPDKNGGCLSTLGCLIFGTANLLRWGMTIPIFAAVAVLLTPYRENTLTLMDHAYPAVNHMVAAHGITSLSGGFLWWSSPGQPAGVLFALIYGAVAIPKAVMSLLASGMSGVEGELQQQVLEAKVKAVAVEVFLSVAVAMLPIALVIFPFIMGVQDFFENMHQLRRVSANNAAQKRA